VDIVANSQFVYFFGYVIYQSVPAKAGVPDNSYLTLPVSTLHSRVGLISGHCINPNRRTKSRSWTH
jgi:hypothetical protein